MNGKICGVYLKQSQKSSKTRCYRCFVASIASITSISEKNKSDSLKESRVKKQVIDVSDMGTSLLAIPGIPVIRPLAMGGTGNVTFQSVPCTRDGTDRATLSDLRGVTLHRRGLCFIKQRPNLGRNKFSCNVPFSTPFFTLESFQWFTAVPCFE